MKTTMLRLAIATFAASSLAVPANSAFAHGGENSTCSDSGLNIDVHGDHVIRDYVKGPDGSVGHGEGAYKPGGPGPGFHFTADGLAPGASFCNLQAHPNGFNTPDNVPVPGNR